VTRRPPLEIPAAAFVRRGAPPQSTQQPAFSAWWIGYLPTVVMDGYVPRVLAAPYYEALIVVGARNPAPILIMWTV
jgi:hypothetical protein